MGGIADFKEIIEPIVPAEGIVLIDVHINLFEDLDAMDLTTLAADDYNAITLGLATAGTPAEAIAYLDKVKSQIINFTE